MVAVPAELRGNRAVLRVLAVAVVAHRDSASIVLEVVADQV
jgi:hypothetical protein